MYLDIVEKYFYPGLEKDVKRVVEECVACQTHGSSQRSEPLRLALEYIDRPMHIIGLDFFQRPTTSS